MKNYKYVTKDKARKYREEFLDIIRELQNILRDDFTFQFKFIGSSARNMITFDSKTNIGFDFDINLEINDPEENFSAKEIKLKIINVLNQIIRKRGGIVGPLGFKFCENSTRVITIKRIDYSNSRICYSCDIAIVNNYTDERGQQCQEYIRYNKKDDSYTWQQQPAPYKLEKKIKKIKEHNMWQDVRKLYLDKKNCNDNPDKKSRALYAETINEICERI